MKRGVLSKYSNLKYTVVIKTSIDVNLLQDVTITIDESQKLKFLIKNPPKRSPSRFAAYKLHSLLIAQCIHFLEDDISSSSSRAAARAVCSR